MTAEMAVVVRVTRAAVAVVARLVVVGSVAAVSRDRTPPRAQRKAGTPFTM